MVLPPLILTTLTLGSAMLARAPWVASASVLSLTVIFGVWRPRYWRCVWGVDFFYLLLTSGWPMLPTWQYGWLAAALLFLLALTQRFWFIRLSRWQIKRHLAQTLQQAALVAEYTFVMYLTTDFHQQVFGHEKNLQRERLCFLARRQAFRHAWQRYLPAAAPRYQRLDDNFDKLYEILSALALLVRRNLDHSTFAVAQKELYALSVGIKTYLTMLAAHLSNPYNAMPEASLLADDCLALQDIYQDALHIVAADPVVFILFIQDIGALQQTLQTLATLLLEV